jgi:hypothetical protein
MRAIASLGCEGVIRAIASSMSPHVPSQQGLTPIFSAATASGITTVRTASLPTTPVALNTHMGLDFAGSEVLVTLQRLGGTPVVFVHARSPTHSPPDVKTGGGTSRSLYTLLHLCMFLFCLLRVWLFAMGRVLT